MKRTITLLLALALLFAPCACGKADSTSAETPQPVETAAPEMEEVPEEPTEHAAEQPTESTPEEPTGSGDKVLVVYFSRTGEQYNVGVIDHGNTAVVAEMIGEATGADLYEILPADDHYPMTYDELTDMALEEQKDGARPTIAGELPDLADYDTIFIGAPVWWGDWPMILYTFFESTPLEGKTLIPFSTHEGSGLSGFDRSLAAAYPDCTVADGLAVRGADAQNAPEKVRASVSAWLDNLGLLG